MLRCLMRQLEDVGDSVITRQGTSALHLHQKPLQHDADHPMRDPVPELPMAVGDAANAEVGGLTKEQVVLVRLLWFPALAADHRDPAGGELVLCCRQARGSHGTDA